MKPRPRLGISRVTLSRVLHGPARISPSLAVRLEEAGVGRARAWLAMQSAYDLAAERVAGLPKVTRLDPVAWPATSKGDVRKPAMHAVCVLGRWA